MLYTLTHIAAALVGEEGQEEEVGEDKGGGGNGRRTAKPAPRSRTFTFATLPQFSEEDHALSGKDGRLTFHCLHNLD